MPRLRLWALSQGVTDQDQGLGQAVKNQLNIKYPYMKTSLLHTTILTALLLVISTTAGLATNPEIREINEPDTSETLFVVLTSGDAETQMMALVLAMQSLNQGASVRVLLCSEGGNLALAAHESPAFAPAGRSPKQLLGALMQQGVQVEVCGIFLPNRPETEADLTDGITAAAPPEVAAFMRRPNVRMFTF